MSQNVFSKLLEPLKSRRSKSKHRNNSSLGGAYDNPSGGPASSSTSSRSNLEQARSADGEPQSFRVQSAINTASSLARAITPGIKPDESLTTEKPNSTPSRPLAQRVRDGAIIVLDFTSKISEATDLLKPLKAVSEALKKTLEIARDVNNVNEDWDILIKRLNFHLATIEYQQSQLEEDEKIAKGSTPLPNSEIKKLLGDYANQLNAVYQLLSENAPTGSSVVGKVVDLEHNKGIIVQKSQQLDDIFKSYTTSIQALIANTVVQLKEDVHQVHVDVLKAAAKAHLDRLRSSDVYGKQHGLCLQGTRIKTLNAIRQWANDQNHPRWMFCLLDVAGSGKSTVAKHMAEEWRKQEKLVARFFFSRDTSSTMSTNLFCSTISDLFASQNPAFKEAVQKFVDHKVLPFDERFKGMITQPLQALNKPAILTIDALDECNNEGGERDELLRTLEEQVPSVPNLRVLVTGRPERDIKRRAETLFGHTNFSKLEEGDEDVKLYIENRLQKLSLADRNSIYTVIQQAEGLFIWARIACDLLEKTINVNKLLNILKQDVTLDYLYRIALEESIPKDSASPEEIVTILQMILAAKRPLSVAELEKLAPIPTIVEGVVSLLGSFLLYKDRDDPIRLLHATFREYITDRQKAGGLFVQVELGHHLLATGCITMLNKYSKMGIDLLDKDKVSISTFIYSSQAWVHHCTSSNRKLGLNGQVLEFVQNELYAWMDQVKRWEEIDVERSIRSLLDLSRGGTSPLITRVLVEGFIKRLETEITLVNKAEKDFGFLGFHLGKYFKEELDRFFLFKGRLFGEEGFLLGGFFLIPPYEQLKKEFEELAKTLPKL